MEDKWILVALDALEGVGRKTISRLLNSGCALSDTLWFGEKEWIGAGMKPEQSRRAVATFNKAWILERQRQIQEAGIQVITFLDQEYPQMLSEIADPPWVLYALGNIELLHTLGVAMVGTRVPTAYGRKVAEALGAELASKGITIISGLAKGIDGICHEAALQVQGRTIAVLGTAIDTVYPAENHGLYWKIARTGLVISEYPPGTKSHPGLFPQRNRIIAGLSRGTLVVEADARSGSLITADCALESGRDVFAVPGPITSPKSRGTLQLIKQGAKLVTEAEDVMEEYTASLDRTAVPVQGSAACAQSSSMLGAVDGQLSSEEQRIVELLEQGDQTLDELLTMTAWDFGLLHSVLLSLIIKKRVLQLAGARYHLI